MGKKKRREINNEAQNDVSIANGDSESHENQPKKKKKHREKEKQRKNDTLSSENEMPTVSIAVPGSIIINTQSYELATRLAGQIARAATIFRIDEVVVFDNKSTSEDDSADMVENNSDKYETGAAFLIRILSYLETPQYLRKGLFPMHNSLKFVGLLPPLDAPHHLRKHEWASYREGITLKNQNQGSVGTLVDVGLSQGTSILCARKSFPFPLVDFFFFDNLKLSDEHFPNNLVVVLKSPSPRTFSKQFAQYADDVGDSIENTKRILIYDSWRMYELNWPQNVMIDQVIEPGRRVTVAMGTNRNLDAGAPRKIVPSSRPREDGMYWGYKVRYASNISSVFKNCPYKEGYDYRMGTSEHGLVIKSSELTLPSFRHLLIAFGGLAGLEECIEEDNNLKGKNVREAFDLYLNTCPHQGSRTIRTEEAVFLSLQYFQEPINRVLHKYKR